MEFDEEKYDVLTWKHWTALHYILNPGLAFNELIPGQRVPKIMLIDKQSDKPLLERLFVPCPHCGEIHNGRIWTKQNSTAFKNWFGLYCPECGRIIPCLRNATSFVIIALTSPIWVWFKERWRTAWLKKQPERYQNIKIDIPKYEDISWIKMGLSWGGFMFVLMAILLPVMEGNKFTFSDIMIGIPLWTLAGLLYGYIMKKWMGKKTPAAKKVKS